MVNTLSNVIFFFYFLGADIIITYFVPQLLDWLSENWGSAGQMENR